MAKTVAEWEEIVERLEDAIGQNVLEVQFADGRTVTFSTWEELIQRYNFALRKAGIESGRQRLLMKFDKGLQA